MALIQLDNELEIRFEERGDGRIMEFNPEVAIRFYREIAIRKSGIRDNEFGLYNVSQLDRYGKMKFASFSGPEHILSSRKVGCAWNPKGRIVTNASDFQGQPVEYNGEQCPDELWNGTWEPIFGAGNKKRDFLGTPEGRAILNTLIDNVYLALGNSTHDLARWGQHPVIADADENGWYKEDDAKWEDYVDQQNVNVGYMTIVDELRNQGVPNFNIPFNTGWVNGKNFIGDAHEAIDRVLNNLPTKMKIYSKRPSGAGQIRPLIVKVSTGIFQKFEEEMVEKWGNLREAFLYEWNSDFAGAEGFSGVMPGVLRYKGHLIISDDDQELFDEMTGTVTHRITAFTPGVVGIGFDVPPAGQFNGMGLRMVQRLEPPYQGKIFMDTTFVLGVGLINKDFVANSSLTLTPETL